MPKTKQYCPICGKDQIGQDQQRCPQCDADLTCFWVLDALPEQGEVVASPVGIRKMKIWGLIGGGGILLLVVSLGWMLYQNHKVARTLADNQNRLEQVNRTMLALVEKIEAEKEVIKKEAFLQKINSQQMASESKDLEPRAPDAKPEPSQAKSSPSQVNPEPRQPKPEPSQVVRQPPLSRQTRIVRPTQEQRPFFWYETTDKDTLWSIADRFYHNGRYYPVLLIMNPQVSLYEIKAGQRLKILKNPKDAVYVFNRSIVRQGSVVFFWYQIQPGDRPQTLSRKFYRAEDQYSIIEKLNPNLRFEPGQRIKIWLPDL